MIFAEISSSFGCCEIAHFTWWTQKKSKCINFTENKKFGKKKKKLDQTKFMFGDVPSKKEYWIKNQTQFIPSKINIWKWTQLGWCIFLQCLLPTQLEWTNIENIV